MKKWIVRVLIAAAILGLALMPIAQIAIADDGVGPECEPTPRPSLEFQPEEWETGSAFLEYTAVGDICNTGDEPKDVAEDIRFWYEVTQGGKYVVSVEFVGDFTSLAPGECRQLQVLVVMNEDWPSTGNGYEAKIWLYAEPTNREGHITQVRLTITSHWEEPPPPTPPQANFSLDCKSYQFGLESGGCPESARATLAVTVTHRLGTFSINREAAVSPGNATSGTHLLPQIYGHTEAEGTIATFCGGVQTSQEEWILDPPLECGEYLAQCNETCASAGFECEAPWICFLTRPGSLGSDKCRNPYNLESQTCSAGVAGCYQGCDPEGTLGGCLEGLTCISVEEIENELDLSPAILGVCVNPEYPQQRDCRPPDEEPPSDEEEFVPEPSSVFLLGTGLAGLAGYAGLSCLCRRTKKQ